MALLLVGRAPQRHGELVDGSGLDLFKLAQGHRGGGVDGGGQDKDPATMEGQGQQPVKPLHPVEVKNSSRNPTHVPKRETKPWNPLAQPPTPPHHCWDSNRVICVCVCVCNIYFVFTIYNIQYMFCMYTVYNIYTYILYIFSICNVYMVLYSIQYMYSVCIY